MKILEENAKKYIYYQETLGIETSRFEDLEDLRNDLNMRMAVWIFGGVAIADRQVGSDFLR